MGKSRKFFVVYLLAALGGIALCVLGWRKHMLTSNTIYTVGIPDYWETLTPPLQHSLVGDAVIEYQVEPLIRMGEQGIMEPIAAKSWELSADHLKLVFRIDTTRRFSDGSFLCANDFKRSWEDGLRMTPKSSNSSLADGLGNIKGYSHFKKKGKIEGVRVVGKDTLPEFGVIFIH